MTDALIGHTGFVGGALKRARSFDAMYRSTDIAEIRGREFDLVVCCGAPAEKWKANADPEGDRARLAVLTDALEHVRARRFVLVSTVDVYASPSGADESTPLDPAAMQPYGRHRWELEEFCRARFDATVVRLPGLYGQGIKKNALFDLLNGRPLDAIPGNAEFQFYDVERVWHDIGLVLAAGLRTVNVTAEPTSMNDIARGIFDVELPVPFKEGAPRYDLRSRHAALVGGRDGYWFDRGRVLAGITRFVAEERAR